ncbi:pitrilysin family protein [Pseudoxanthobacter sp. M-2]|uniref:M16 family metallopeptidase n=1 Tax=Pseudoxanthobacter sp. M-2 TaxID=3078754 RepID=UPI0038FCCB03
MSVETTRLDNGLLVATESMPHIESAAIGVWVGAGSRSEREGEHGISHLLEHMAFKGTKRRTARQIAEEIEAVGGELNAATSVENTYYYARVLGDDVALAADILGDILLESEFDPEELKREQHVIVQEIGAADDTPDDKVFDLFQGAAWPEQPIGKPILGTVDTVRGFGAPALRAYLGSHYRAPQMVLSAAGALDHATVVALAEEKLAALPTSGGPDDPPARYFGGERREERDLQETQIVLGFEGRRYGSDDYYAAQLLASVLGGGMSSRLFQEIRESRGLCYSIYAFHWGFTDTGLMGVHVATGEGDVPELVDVLTAELAKAAGAITDAEVDRSRAQMRAGLLMSRESAASRASQMARQILVYGRPLTMQEILSRIDAVAVADVRRVAEELIRGTPPTLAAIGPLDGLEGLSDIAGRLGTGVAALA